MTSRRIAQIILTLFFTVVAGMGAYYWMTGTPAVSFWRGVVLLIVGYLIGRSFPKSWTDQPLGLMGALAAVMIIGTFIGLLLDAALRYFGVME